MSKGTSLARLIGSIGVLALPFLASAQGTGCWLRDAVAPTATTVYVLCEQGTVHITKDAGATWLAVDTGAKTKLTSMAAVDTDHVVLVGDSGTILATGDGGKTWQAVVNDKKETVTKENLLAINNAGSQLWTSGFDGAILHSTDGGRTWDTQTSGTTMGLEDIFFLDANRGWAVGWSGTILRTADGGKKWEDVKSKNATWTLSSVYFRDANNGWAAGFAGQLLQSRDGGATWEKQDSSVKASLKDVMFDNANRAWITSDEQFLLSEDGGVKWRAVKTDRNVFLRRLIPVGNSLWAVGQLGVLKQGTGLTWTAVASLVPAAAKPPAAAAAPARPVAR